MRGRRRSPERALPGAGRWRKARVRRRATARDVQGVISRDRDGQGRGDKGTRLSSGAAMCPEKYGRVRIVRIFVRIFVRICVRIVRIVRIAYVLFCQNPFVF